MKTRFHWLIIFLFLIVLVLPSTPAHAGTSGLSLIQEGATQPVPATSTFVNFPTQTAMPFVFATRTVTPSSTTTPNDVVMLTHSLGQNKLVVVALVISFSVLVATVVGFGRKKE